MTFTVWFSTTKYAVKTCVSEKQHKNDLGQVLGKYMNWEIPGSRFKTLIEV